MNPADVFELAVDCSLQADGIAVYTAFFVKRDFSRADRTGVHFNSNFGVFCKVEILFRCRNKHCDIFFIDNGRRASAYVKRIEFVIFQLGRAHSHLAVDASHIAFRKAELIGI